MIRDFPAVKAGYWFGPVGSMVALPNLRGSLSVSPSREREFERTVSGRVRGWQSQRVRRVWDCAIPAMSPSELGALEYAETLVGAWVTPDAAVINVLSPDQAAFRDSPTNLSPAGTVQVEPGVWVPQATVSATPTLLSSRSTPVPASGRITFSAWVRGTNVQLSVRQGGTTTNTYSSSVTSSQWVRHSVTVDVSAWTTKAALFFVSAATMVAGPAVTWTDSLREWGSGRGCSRASLTLGDQDLRRTSPTSFNASFTVTELD